MADGAGGRERAGCKGGKAVACELCGPDGHPQRDTGRACRSPAAAFDQAAQLAVAEAAGTKKRKSGAVCRDDFMDKCRGAPQHRDPVVLDQMAEEPDILATLVEGGVEGRIDQRGEFADDRADDGHCAFLRALAEKTDAAAVRANVELLEPEAMEEVKREDQEVA